MSVRCSLCSERVARKELEAHWKADLDYAPFVCRLCGFSFFSATDALQHFRSPEDTLHPHETRPQIVEKRVGAVEARLKGLRAELTEASPPDLPEQAEDAASVPLSDLASLLADPAQSDWPDEEGHRGIPDKANSQPSEVPCRTRPQGAEVRAPVASIEEAPATQSDDGDPYQVDLACPLLDATLESRPADSSMEHDSTARSESQWSDGKGDMATKSPMEAVNAEQPLVIKPANEENAQEDLFLVDKKLTPFSEQYKSKKTSPKILSNQTVTDEKISVHVNQKKTKCKLCQKEVDSYLIQHATKRHCKRRVMFRCRLCPSESIKWNRGGMEDHQRKWHKEASDDSSSIVDLRGDPEAHHATAKS